MEHLFYLLYVYTLLLQTEEWQDSDPTGFCVNSKLGFVDTLVYSESTHT